MRKSIKQWESSGETARAYCVRKGLKETRFHWWKKVLQDRGKWKPGESGEASTLLGEQPSVAFAAVEVRESAPLEISEPQQAHRAAGTLELCVGEQYRVVLPAGFDPVTLQRVLSVLDGRGC